MADMIAGPGQGLPPPQSLAPPFLFTAPFTAPTNRVVLNAGNALPIPAGTFIVQGGASSAVQWKDPIDREWKNLTTPAPSWGLTIRSDGFNFRVANVSGVATGAEVTAGGSDYRQSTTQVHASTGTSEWHAVIGGALGHATIIEAGKNYGLPPLVFVPAPPHPGICAQGHATIDNEGRVDDIIWDVRGAGYPFPPQILIVPDPFDPHQLAFHEAREVDRLERVENARARVDLEGHGEVTAVLLRVAGSAEAAAPTLTISGSGTGATAHVLPTTWLAPAEDRITIQPASGP